MHTSCALTVSPSMLCAGGDLLLGGSSQGGPHPWGVGGLLPVGGSPPGGISQHALRQMPPVNRMTDACKNITFPELRCGQ